MRLSEKKIYSRIDAEHRKMRLIKELVNDSKATHKELMTCRDNQDEKGELAAMMEITTLNKELVSAVEKLDGMK